jgi:hypothetical protein
MLLGDVEPPLQQMLVAAADFVAADFRRDQPTVRASHWEVARGWLAERSCPVAQQPSLCGVRPGGGCDDTRPVRECGGGDCIGRIDGSGTLDS